MEVVLLVVAVLGTAMVAVPRLRRRRRPAARAVTAAAPAAAWMPPADDGDDDLGWEGEPAPKPSQWEQWHSDTEPPELPSVERWRTTAAAADEWDDDLGWE